MTEWSVEPKKLLNVLSVLDLVPSRPGIGCSIFLQMNERDGKMSFALSSDVSGVVKVKGSGNLKRKEPLFLDRRLFFPFVFTAKTYKSDKPFVFSMLEKQVLVQQGKRKATFDLGPVTAGYGDLNAAGGTVLPITDNMSDAIRVAADCATPDPTVPELNCVYTVKDKKALVFYASNQLVVFNAVHKVQGDFPERLAFPLFLVPLISNEGVKEIRLKPKEVILQFNCGVLWQGVSVKAQKGFPRKTVDDLIAEGHMWPERFQLQTRRLGLVTSRFSQYLTAVRRQDWLMNVKGVAGEKKLLLEVKIPQGIFREHVTTENEIEKDFLVDWPLDILLPVFEHLYKQKDKILDVRFGKKTPYLLSTDGVSVVVTRREK